MPLELDHVFVASSIDAPEVELLRSLGFKEGDVNDHPGQGTASRRIFFENTYLEFIWLTDPRAATEAPVFRTGLAQRADPRHDSSHFGFGLRSSVDPMPEVPFETWKYCPAYLPEGSGFAMPANSEKLDEPLIFVLPWSRTPNWEVPEHPNGAQRLTKVSFAGHTPSPSGVITAFLGLGLVWPEDAVDPLLRIVFDHGARGERHDLRPHLPLALTW